MRPSYRETVARLSTAGKSAYGAPAYSRYVNRPLGRRLAAVAHLLGATPNQVTAVSAVASYSAAAVIALGPVTTATGVVVALLLVLGYALDSADGQLSRLRGGGSASGEWLDHIVDTAKTVLVHGALIITLIRTNDPHLLILTATVLLFLLASIVAFFGWQLSELLRARAGALAAKPSRAPLWRTLLRTPSDWGVVCLIFALWSTPAFWWAYGALALANVAITVVALPTWFKQAGHVAGGPA